MSWSNWVYLLLGLGLGVGSRWLLGQLNEQLREKGNQKQVNQDVTGLLEKLKQTQLAYQQAHEMSLFKAGFLARTSHELRSPLNSLIGLHQLILSDLCDNPTEEREFVAQAHDAALKLVKLMDEIMDVARIQHGTNHLKIQPLQLAHLLKEVYSLTYMLAANRNFTLQLSLPDPEIYVLADPRGLRQVLVSVVDTCIAQMEEGSIFISAQPMTASESVLIWLDVHLPASIWCEPVDLMQSQHMPQEATHKKAAPSPAMRLLLNQNLLELMKGSLELLQVPTSADESDFTRIQLAIPLVIPETASLEQEEDRG